MLQSRNKLFCIASRFLNKTQQCSYVLPIRKSVCHRLIHTSSCYQVKHSKWVMPYLQQLKLMNDRLLEKGMVPIDRRSTYLEWNLKAELYAFGQRLHEEFDESLLLAALVDHSHILHSQQQKKELGLQDVVQPESNERMAAEGRQQVRTVCEEFIRQAWPSIPLEGIRSVVDYLSSDEVLGEVGQAIGLKDLVFAEPYPPSKSVLATAACAVVSALHQSSGPGRAEDFVVDFVVTSLSGKSIWDLWQVSEPLSLLQDIMSRSGVEVEPRLVHQTGRNTLEASYQVAVYDQQNKTYLGSGYGESVEIATNEAARNALDRLFGTGASQATLPFPLSLPPPQSKIPHSHTDLSPSQSEDSNPSLETWSLDSKDPRSDNIVVC